MFFKCSPAEKAKRRLRENNKEKRKITLQELKKSLKKRDYSDKNRKESPLLFVKGAVLVDTTNLTIKQMEAKLKRLVQKAIQKKYENL